MVLHVLLFAICYLRKTQNFPFNVECLTREPTLPILTSLVLYRGLNPRPPALEAISLPLGYRGGKMKKVRNANSIIMFLVNAQL